MITKPIGNDAVVEMLANLARQHRADPAFGFHHAWIFTGPSGVGKFLAAQWWAAALKCQGPTPGDPCGTCSSCRGFRSGAHRDLHILEPTKKSSGGPYAVRIDETRALIPMMALRPFHEGPNIAIIRDAHTAGDDAQNCLLKLLEEPPGFAVLILVVDDAAALLTTIRSRCRILRFGVIDDETIHSHLLEAGRSAEEASAATSAARGSLGRALSLDEDQLTTDNELLLNFEAISSKDFGAAIKFFEGLTDRKTTAAALKEILTWQELKIRVHFGEQASHANPALADILKACGRFDSEQLVGDANKVLRTITALARNANVKVAIRDLLLHMRK
jgi:DNA polymerase-3 subunit delta'